ncbi:MAG: hypothetical protein JNM62_13640 [Flavobacteriales bacterium]|nr:hypothetical protein [Flavobacteriales bacterium]
MDQTTPPVTVQRPLLLTILCGLSIVFSIWNFAGGVRSAFTKDPELQVRMAREKLDASIAQMNKDVRLGGVVRILQSAVVMAERSAIHAEPLGYSAMALSLVSLAGVLLMWRLRRIGFWVYLTSSIAGLAIPIWLLGAGVATMFAMGIGGLFSVAFIILYAVNLKHMR